MAEAIADIQFLSYSPENLDVDQWTQVQKIGRRAFRAALPEAIDDIAIDTFMGTYDQERWIDTRLDPNKLVGNGNLSDQAYADPQIVIAYEGTDPIGYIYTANNVSGKPFMRSVKRHFPSKNYAWFREIAVEPDVWGNNIGEGLALTALEAHLSTQNATAYVWKNRLPAMYQALTDKKRFGFKETGVHEGEKPFGPTAPSVDLARLETNVGDLKVKLTKRAIERRKEQLLASGKLKEDPQSTSAA